MKHLGDITKINGYEVPEVDIICGGSPCQDLSVAGKRAGLAGERSGLFMDQIRIIKEMREKEKQSGKANVDIRPRYMVWENVPGAFSSNKGEDFRAVLEETAKVSDKDAVIPEPEKGKWTPAGCIVGDGWSIAWRLHDAQFWGVPQRRKRIALVADFGGQSAPEILFERDGMPGNIETSREKGQGTSPDVEGCVGKTGYDNIDSDSQSYTLKIRGGVDVDSSGKKAGKGPLIQTELSGTLGVSQDQTLFANIKKNEETLDGNNDSKAVVYGITSYESNSMKSSNPHSGIYQADTSRTLDLNGGNPACNQGGMAVVEQTGAKVIGFNRGNGSGIPAMEEKQPTLQAAFENHSQDTRYRPLGEVCSSVSATYGMGGNNQPFVVKQVYDASRRHNYEEFGDVCETVQAHYGTGGGNVPMVMEKETYQDVTGTLSPGAHAGSYNGQDAYNDMLVAKPSFGIDCYNQTQTEEQTMGITSAATDPHHIPCTYQNVTGTIDCCISKGTSNQLANNDMFIANSIVRRLTPMECERLQGYPDHWTDIGEWVDSKGKKHKDADSPRYKALGNSIALPFWEWMAHRMCSYLKEPTMASLFDGIGGFPLVFSRAGCKPIWASEIEEFPIAVTKIRFPENE